MTHSLSTDFLLGLEEKKGLGQIAIQNSKGFLETRFLFMWSKLTPWNT